MRRVHSKTGFSLVELVIVCAVVPLISLGMALIFKALAQTAEFKQATLGGETYTRSPNYSAFRQAVHMHRSLQDAMDRADSVFVFGGSNADPADSDSGVPALVESYAVNNWSLMPAGVNAVRTSLDAYNRLYFEDSSAFESGVDAQGHDFSVVCVEGFSNVIAIAHVRRETGVVDGEALVFYRVSYYSDETGWSDSDGYRFCLSVAEDNWAVPVGARHYWHRYDGSSWNRKEEGGTRLVFPDPYILSGHKEDEGVRPFSRFSFFVEVSN